MQDSYKKNITTTNINEIVQDSAPVIIQTDVGAKDGQNKCPKCGATEISLNVSTGKLKCSFCRCEFDPEKVQEVFDDISKLHGQIIGSGATDIVADVKDVMTFKCSSCGAEVVVDTSESLNARCHWCRNILSVNQQIPNGSIPDVVLPFSVRKEEAKMQIEKFVGKRKFFANPKFKAEFTTDNIMGVYFPYMVVDVNGHSRLIGQGEHLVRKYTVGDGDNKKVRYDANLFEVEREFDLTIEDLTVESSADKLNKKSSNKTTNVINAIMPFDIDNAVKWDANYLRGYSSEKRDVNIDQLRVLVATQSKDIARFAANDTLRQYDRGVAWSSEEFEIKGQQWKAAYLPVWLYSYQEVSGSKKVLHYVAVNARTKETMGSVPVHVPKLILFSILVEILGFIMMFSLDDFDYNWLFLFLGIAYYFIIYARYRNDGARHMHELETKKNVTNLRKVDRLLKQMKGLSNSKMWGANNEMVHGQTVGIGDRVFEHVTSENPVASFVRDNIEKND